MLAPLNTALATNGAAMLGALAPLAEALHGMEETGRAVPGPVQALAWAEGNGVDQPIFVRGNPKNAGAMTPRRSLEALEGEALHPLGPGSGRLELAERLLDETNPLLAAGDGEPRVACTSLGAGLCRRWTTSARWGSRPRTRSCWTTSRGSSAPTGGR
jgi:hypothetical protein